jgi:hypothetical protein
MGTPRTGTAVIVLHDGKPQALGESQVHHNLYPTNTKLIEGKSLRVVSPIKINMRGWNLRFRPVANQNSSNTISMT